MIEQIEDGAPVEQGNLATPAQVELHCPFKCGLEQCDERGYCEHLLGFANVEHLRGDHKMFEPCKPITRRALDENGKPTGESERTGNYRVLGRKHQLRPVPKGCRLINPTSRQFHEGVWKIANRWVSWRVYHADGQAALLPDKAAVTPNKAG